MIFDTIDPKLSLIQVEQAKRKFSQFLCYLAIRSDNYHCFGNKGGNNFQLLLLADYTHHLVSNTLGVCRFRIRPKMEWDLDYLVSSSLDKIREDVDFVFGTVLSNNHALSLLVTSSGGDRLREICLGQKTLFPNLAAVVENPVAAGVLSLTWQEKLILASIVCDGIARQVDKANLPKYSNVVFPLDAESVRIMDSMPPEIVILSVRSKIGIERLVRANLDEHPTFGPIIVKINKLVIDP